MSDTIYCPLQTSTGSGGRMNRQECDAGSCGIWSTDEHNCSIIVIADTLRKLTASVEYYTSLFGPRGIEKEKDAVLDVAGPDPSNLADYDGSGKD